jgi:rSAM/selenodomain-associated transferase 2
MFSVSVIIPAYHDAAALARTLDSTNWAGAEVIVAAVADDTSLTELRGARPDILWVDAARGRARQMNAAAAGARGDWLLFLHADTRLPVSWRDAIEAAGRSGAVAGCFRFTLDSPSPFARIIERGVAWRVQMFSLPYGDQALFVRRECFEALRGFTDIPIMEDVDFVRRVRRQGRFYRSSLPVVTSARRWERDGWIARTARHLALTTLYFCGLPPSRLIRLDRARADHPEPAARRISL